MVIPPEWRQEEYGINENLIEWADFDEYNDEYSSQDALKAVLPDDAQIFSYPYDQIIGPRSAVKDVFLIECGRYIWTIFHCTSYKSEDGLKSWMREAYAFPAVQDARAFLETKEADLEDWGIKEDLHITLDQISDNYSWTIRYLLDRIDETEQRMKEIENEIEELKSVKSLYTRMEELEEDHKDTKDLIGEYIKEQEGL